tara:strand:+ start:1374 stop:1616 length:243 start_codon:yes stop_codon:yes gene_type:complete
MSTENPFNKTNLNHGDYRKLVSKEADKVIKLGVGASKMVNLHGNKLDIFRATLKVVADRKGVTFTTKMDEDKNLWIKLIK